MDEIRILRDGEVVEHHIQEIGPDFVTVYLERRGIYRIDYGKFSEPAHQFANGDGNCIDCR